MSEELKTIQEAAKAKQEVAKTTGKAIDAAETLGKFISKFIAGPIEQGMGIVHDKLIYMRWERQLRYMEKAHELMKKLNIEEPTRPIPMQLVIPMLQGASLEETDDIQDRWAKLLVNAADADSGVTVTRNYITILEHLTPYEATLLDKIYSVPEDQIRKGVWTKNLPDELIFEAPEGKDMKPHQELELALANLNQLGVIDAHQTWSGTQMMGCVSQTILGRSFINACRLRNEAKAI